MTAPTPLEGVLLSIASEQALELAAARRDGQVLSTIRLLLGILAADADGSWSGVELQATYLDADDASRFPDPSPEPAGAWHGVALTATATAALSVAASVASEYHLVPVPPAVLALGLLADPEAGATRALLSESALTHPELLELVQDEVLDVTLERLDLDSLLDDARGGVSRRGAADPALRDPGWIPPEETALSTLAGVVEQLQADEELSALFSAMWLDAEGLTQANRELADVPDEPAAEVYERTRRRYSTETPSPLEVVVGCALTPSARVAEALRRLGLSSSELAGQAAEVRERRAGNDATSTAVFLASLINGLWTLATTALVVLAAAEGAWWKLVFVWLVWMGHPQNGPLGSALTSVVLFVFVSPAAGIVSFIGIAADLLQAEAERRALLARTGVYVTLRELRSITCRLLRARGLRAQRHRQFVRARMRALRDGRQLT